MYLLLFDYSFQSFCLKCQKFFVYFCAFLLFELHYAIDHDFSSEIVYFSISQFYLFFLYISLLSTSKLLPFHTFQMCFPFTVHYNNSILKMFSNNSIIEIPTVYLSYRLVFFSLKD